MKKLISLALIIAIAAAFCMVSVSAEDTPGVPSPNPIGITSITFSTVDGAAKEAYQGGSTAANLFDGETLIDAGVSTFSTAGILLVQNLNAKDADLGPVASCSFTLELEEIASILAVTFDTYTESGAMIGTAKDGKVTVEYSIDGSEYILSGDYDFAPTASETALVEDFYVELDEIVEAKFLKLTYVFGDVPPYQGDPNYWTTTTNYGYTAAEWLGFTEFGIELFEYVDESSEEEPSEEPSKEEPSEEPSQDTPILGEKTNVADGKSYEIAGNLEGSYTDNGSKLTDGEIPETASYSEPGIVGFNSGSDFYKENGYAQVVIDLGETFDVTEISMVASNLGSAGVNAPGTVKYAYSTNGNDFTEIGEGEYDKDLSETGINVINTVSKAVKARYIKVMFSKAEGAGNWMMISEIQVLNNGTATPIPDESEEPSKPAPTPKTGDAGMIALAIVSVITLAGVVIVKNK